MSSVDERIAAIVQPLRDEQARIENEIAAAEATLAELKAAQKRVGEILRRADGQPLRTPKPKPKSEQSVAAHHVEHVREFLANWADNDGQIQIRPLAREIASAANGAQHPGEEAVRRAVHVLHESGELRLVAKGRGGSKIYAYIGGANGKT